MTTKLLCRNTVLKSIIVFTLYIFTVNVSSQNEFITTWKTDNTGTSNDTSITIPTTGGGYNYDVDWTYDGITFNAESTGVAGNITHDYGLAGTYTVAIRGAFPRIYFNSQGDRQKIMSIEQWGTNPWTSMQAAFFSCLNLVSNATDTPNLSGVLDASDMFWNAISFNADISGWDVSNVTDMSYMLGITDVTGDLSSWDVSNVTNMYAMFSGTTVFNGDISTWDVSKVTDMGAMFDYSEAFNGDLSSWDVSSVSSMYSMFYYSEAFNGDISTWDVSNVTDMDFMFEGAIGFNGDLSTWNVSNVVSMANMFRDAQAFNGDISSWNVSKVEDMSNIFSGATAFNGDISNWDVSLVNEMSDMFSGATIFNGDLSSWDVSNVGNMSYMFSGATAFNGDISSWNVSNVGGMIYMFSGATAFNGDISSWDVSNVMDMSYMFSGATSFDRDLGSWDISNVGGMADMFAGATLSTTNYDNTLIGWNTLTGGETQIPTFIFNFSGGNSTYCNGEAARLSLMNDYTWGGLTDGGLDCSGLGLDDYNLTASLRLYPNPVKNILHIKGDNILERITVSDINGSVIQNIEVTGNKNQKNISLTNISSGIYFVNVYSNKGQITKKIIKE